MLRNIASSHISMAESFDLASDHSATVLSLSKQQPPYVTNRKIDWNIHGDLKVLMVGDKMNKFAGKHQKRLDSHENNKVISLLNNSRFVQ